MNKLIVLFALVLEAGVFAQTNTVPAEVDAAKAITRLREELVDSFNKADLERLLLHLDTNVVVTWQNAEVSIGREGVRQYYDRMMSGDHPIVREVKADPEVLGRNIYGDWAVSWGVMNDVFRLTGGQQLPFNSRFTATIARRGDRWQVTTFHVSVDAFENPVLGIATKKVGRMVGVVGTISGVVLGFFLTRLFLRRSEDAT